VVLYTTSHLLSKICETFEAVDQDLIDGYATEKPNMQLSFDVCDQYHQHCIQQYQYCYIYKIVLYELNVQLEPHVICV